MYGITFADKGRILRGERQPQTGGDRSKNAGRNVNGQHHPDRADVSGIRTVQDSYSEVNMVIMTQVSTIQELLKIKIQ